MARNGAHFTDRQTPAAIIIVTLLLYQFDDEEEEYYEIVGVERRKCLSMEGAVIEFLLLLILPLGCVSWSCLSLYRCAVISFNAPKESYRNDLLKYSSSKR